MLIKTFIYPPIVTIINIYQISIKSKIIIKYNMNNFNIFTQEIIHTIIIITFIKRMVWSF